MSVSNGPSIVTSGLVLSLDAADKNSYPGSGTTWTDMSGNGNNGTLTNGPTFSSANQGSIVFDGADDVVVITGIPLITGTGDFTLCSFVRRSAINTVDYICGNYGIGNNGVELYYVNNRINFYMVGLTIQGNTLVSDTNWHYVCGTRESGTIRCYLDGILDGSGNGNTTIPGNNPFTIGNAFNYTAEAFIGNIANCTAYNRALTASEIAQNYSATKTRFGL